MPIVPSSVMADTAAEPYPTVRWLNSRVANDPVDEPEQRCHTGRREQTACVAQQVAMPPPRRPTIAADG